MPHIPPDEGHVKVALLGDPLKRKEKTEQEINIETGLVVADVNPSPVRIEFFASCNPYPPQGVDPEITGAPSAGDAADPFPFGVLPVPYEKRGQARQVKDRRKNNKEKPIPKTRKKPNEDHDIFDSINGRVRELEQATIGCSAPVFVFPTLEHLSSACSILEGHASSWPRVCAETKDATERVPPLRKRYVHT